MSNKPRNNRKGEVRRSGKRRETSMRQERLFARIVSGEGQITFTDITSHLGQPCPFSKPQAFMAVRASEDVCAFHLLHLSKKKSKEFGSSSTTMPSGGLSRLERRAKSHNLEAGDLVIEISSYIRDTSPEEEMSLDELLVGLSAPVESPGLDDLFADSGEDGDLGDLGDLFADESGVDADVAAESRPQRQSEVSTWRYSISRSESGLGSVSPVDEERFVSLDTRPVRASVYMLSPVTNRPVGLSFIGFLGKAGDEQSLSRIAGKILASALHLPAFQTVTGLSGVALDNDGFDLGAAIAASVGPAKFAFKVFAFETAGGAPAASGYVEASANLEYADINRGRLYFDLAPSAELADGFSEVYGTHVASALSAIVSTTIGEAGMHQIIKDIVNGGVTADTVEQIVEAGATVGGIDVAADGRWRQHS